MQLLYDPQTGAPTETPQRTTGWEQVMLDRDQRLLTTGRVAADARFVVVPAPEGYAGTTYRFHHALRGRVELRLCEPDRG